MSEIKPADNFVVKLKTMEEMSSSEIFDQIRKLGMVDTVREHVSMKRRVYNPGREMKDVARQTIYVAFETPEEERSPLHRLIIEESRYLLNRIPMAA